MSAPPPSAAAPAAIPSGARHGPAPGCAGTGDLRRAWVVFCGHADLAWLKLLAPGFRHCFVVLNDGRHWLTVDPLSCFTELEVQPVPAGFDLPAFYRARGLTVVPAPLGRARARPLPWAPFTCVEAVKRVLGLRARFVLTPRQLYRHLTGPTARPARRRPLPRPAASPHPSRETA